MKPHPGQLWQNVGDPSLKLAQKFFVASCSQREVIAYEATTKKKSGLTIRKPLVDFLQQFRKLEIK